MGSANLLSLHRLAEDVANAGQWLFLKLKEAKEGLLGQVSEHQIPQKVEIWELL